MNAKKKTCKNCGAEFELGEGEISFYKSKGLSLPKRCAECRRRRRTALSEQRESKGTSAEREPLPFDIDYDERSRKADDKREALAPEDKAAKWESDERELARLRASRGFQEAEIHDLRLLTPEETLLVLGNGFDIMHGVKSSYGDFAATLGRHSELRDTLELYLRSEDLWYNFEESLAKLDAGMMLDTVEDWLDIYGAYDEDAQAADYFMAIDMAMEPIYVITNDLPRRFRAWVEKLTADGRTPLTHLMLPKARYLNFNYTDFPELLYGVPHGNIKYIHGCRKRIKGKAKDELILGHVPDAEYLYGSRGSRSRGRRRNSGRAQFAELAREQAGAQWVDYYSEKFTKNTSGIIAKNKTFFESASTFSDVYTIGHSLAEVDYPYFAELLKHNGKKAQWHISYHSLDDFKRLCTFVSRMKLENFEIFRT